MNISYVTIYDASDVRNWSGLGFHIAKALEVQGAEINYVGNLQSGFGVDVRLKKMCLKGLGRLSTGDRSPFLASSYAKQADRRIPEATDIIFSPGSLAIAKMKSRRPKVFYTDATFAGMLNFYDDYRRFSRDEIEKCNQLEQEALDNCTLAIYSSEWAAKTALDNYRVDPGKVRVVPFGANINSVRSLSDIRRIVSSRSRSVCKLLFLGVDWKRKGGDKALQVARHLNENGLNTELHIAGIEKLPLSDIPTFVVNHGFLSKATKEGNNKIVQLLEECHFLILPTTADCSPVVFSEASSFAMPCLATNVGGIPSVITNGKNGIALPPQAGVEEYAQFVQSCFADPLKYEQLAYSSFREFENRLNWEASGAAIMRMLSDSCLS